MFEYLLYVSNCIYFSYKYRREYMWWKYNTRDCKDYFNHIIQGISLINTTLGQ